MIDFFGCLLIFIACTAAGFYQASLLAKRSKQIRMLIHQLQRLETEIVYAMTPLPQAIEQIGKQSAPPLSRLFLSISHSLQQQKGKSTSQCWEEGVHRYWHETALQTNEKEIFLRLGHYLGISDREDQKKYILLSLQQLSAEEDIAREKQQRYEKMYRSLGVLSGLLIIILLL